MAELRIRTVRDTIRVAAPPQRVYQLIANVDRWPRMFDTLLAVEHIGWHGSGERVRFWGTFGERRGSWVSSREVNAKRLQLRFRQERAAYPLASLGGLWLVVPKGTGSLVTLDHYFTVVADDPVETTRLAETITESGTEMLAAVRRAAEHGISDEHVDDMWLAMPNGVRDMAEGVSPR
jgi:aromatase